MFTYDTIYYLVFTTKFWILAFNDSFWTNSVQVFFHLKKLLSLLNLWVLYTIVNRKKQIRVSILATKFDSDKKASMLKFKHISIASWHCMLISNFCIYQLLQICLFVCLTSLRGIFFSEHLFSHSTGRKRHVLRCSYKI